MSSSTTFNIIGRNVRPQANAKTENERLPNELGWTKKSDEITLMNILATTSIVRNATSLLTGGNTAEDSPHGKRDIHGGMF